jgi:hypothetical protein
MNRYVPGFTRKATASKANEDEVERRETCVFGTETEPPTS